MLTIKYHAMFKKDFKRIKKRGYDISRLEKIVELLANEVPLPEQFKDHNLSGNYNGFRECHIAPDWLLIYQVNNNELVLVLSRTGSHSDLF
ncbi:type II toxin-antitoxin system YafQ family toxin [Ruminococcus bromii]|uniref:mRNA interferase YafQ n=2 Tax=Ruminococcus bromii TaxID=40518 RepID=A0A2N0UVF9_9FIRM|nr:type II toxin-antitoxin system YafQ family toxin [Ruminococcus bromii]PKD30967.1 mRNA interferase YafQ [Ruminococcus bromii]